MHNNFQKITKLFNLLILSSLILISLSNLRIEVKAIGNTYYVSTSGNDNNNGTSEATAFKSISKINSLDLIPGDNVLFKCGETWQGESLQIKDSGTASDKITFGSFPQANCLNKPVISGSKSISGWTATNGRPNVYEVDLNSGSNAGNFPNGVNQLFKNDQKMQFGRWPNIDQKLGNKSGGYTTITAQNNGNQITLQDLPNKDWTGAGVHIMGMRWYILNRNITGNSGDTVNLNSDVECWENDCAKGGGWGAWVDNSIETLDQDGEWYFDKDANKVFVYSGSGAPSGVEASTILRSDDRASGGIMLGKDFAEYGISNVVIDNFEVKNWYKNGIAAPTNLAYSENHDLIIKNNLIKNSQEKGIALETWVFDAKDDRESSWRGGYNLSVENNTIDGANHFGIDTYSRNSEFVGNTIQNIGLIKNLDASGMGCGFEGGGGNCTENGDGIRIKNSNPDDTGNNNLVKFNTIKKTGYNGIDILGPNNTLEKNYIDEPCFSKGDCGGIRNFGGADAKNTVIKDNIITNSVGNTDGTNTTFKEVFGFGLYIDFDSDNVVVTGNTVTGSSNTGLVYIDSPNGTVSGNTIYGNGTGTPSRQEIGIGGNKTSLSFNDNIAFSIKPGMTAFDIENKDQLTNSDNNYFFNQFSPDKVGVQADGNIKTLEQWKSYSGKDANSKTDTFTQASGEKPKSQLFYNNTDSPKVITVPQNSKDLNQNPVIGSITLQPFTSRVLLGDVPVISSSSSSVVSSSSSSTISSSSISSLQSTSSQTMSSSPSSIPSSTSSLTSSINSGNSSLTNSLTDCTQTALQNAINSATNGDTINIVCPANTKIPFSSEIVLNKNLTFEGINSPNLSFDGQNSTRLFNISSGTATFKNLTFENGKTASTNNENPESSTAGGAILTGNEVVLNLENTNFKNNTAGVGGAIYSGFQATLNVLNSTFDGNKALAPNSITERSGGAIATKSGGTTNIKGSAFVNNSSEGIGGALNILLGSLNLQDSVFKNNTSKTVGGAIYTDGASENSANSSGRTAGNIVIKNTRFENNISGQDGGAAYLFMYDLDKLDISDSTFIDNKAPNGIGGALRLGENNTTITNSAFVRNEAKNAGAIGIQNPGDVDIKNVLFEQNKATENGGAIVAGSDSGSKINIENATFNKNYAGEYDGAITVWGKPYEDIILKNSVFFENKAGNPYNSGQNTPGNLGDGGNNFQFPNTYENTISEGFTNITQAAVIKDPLLTVFADSGTSVQNTVCVTEPTIKNAGSGFACPIVLSSSSSSSSSQMMSSSSSNLANSSLTSSSSVTSSSSSFFSTNTSISSNSSSQSSNSISSNSPSFSSTNSTISTPPGSNSNFQVGMNLAGGSDWAYDFVFLDIMKSSRMWLVNCPDSKPDCDKSEAAMDLDTNGYPKTMNSKTEPGVVFENYEIPLLTGQEFATKQKYIIKYDGEGTIDYGFVANDDVTKKPGRDEVMVNGMFWPKITSTNPANPIRNIRVMAAGDEALLDSGKIFNQKWLDKFKEFKTFRFMDWLDTNNNKTKNWSDRTPQNYFSWTAKGVPMEIIIELVKQTGVDPWINMPHLATDDYMLQAANFWKTNLPSERKLYLEFSNELWNWQFDQAQYANAEGRKLLAVDSNGNGTLDQDELEAAPGDSYAQWAGMKSYQMCKIWKSVFGQNSNLNCGIGSQPGWYALGDAAMDCPDIVAKGLTDGKACAVNADFLNTSAYVSGNMQNPEVSDQIKSWLANSDPEFAFKQAFKQLKDGSVIPDNGLSVKDLINDFKYYKNVIDTRYPHLKLNVYEGGTHLTVNGLSNQDDQQLIDFFIKVNNRPEMYDIYTELLQGAKDIGVGVFEHFVDIGKPSKYGSFGSLETLDSPLSTAYRYCALLDFQTGVKNCTVQSSSSSSISISTSSSSLTNSNSLSSSNTSSSTSSSVSSSTVSQSSSQATNSASSTSTINSNSSPTFSLPGLPVPSSNSSSSSNIVSSSNSIINPDQIWNNSSIPSYLIEDNNIELTPKKSENVVYGTQDLILKIKNLANRENSKCYFQIRKYPSKDNPNPVFENNLLSNFMTNWTNGSCETRLPKEMQSQNKWQMRAVVVSPTGVKSEILPDILMNFGAIGSVSVGGVSID